MGGGGAPQLSLAATRALGPHRAPEMATEDAHGPNVATELEAALAADLSGVMFLPI